MKSSLFMSGTKALAYGALAYSVLMALGLAASLVSDDSMTLYCGDIHVQLDTVDGAIFAMLTSLCASLLGMGLMVRDRLLSGRNCPAASLTKEGR